MGIPFLLIGVLLLVTFLGGGIVMGTVSFAGLLLAAVWTWEFPRQPTCPRPALAAFMVAFLLMVGASVIPLPQTCYPKDSVRMVQHALMQERLYDLRDAGFAEPGKPKIAHSRNRAGTLRMLQLSLACLAAAALAAHIHPEARERFLRVLILLAALLAVGGVISQWVLPQGKYLWWLWPVEHGKPVACFINRNHFGGYVGLLTPAALIVAATGFINRRWLSAGWWTVVSIVMLTAVFLSHSRGAWLATAASLIAVTGLLLIGKPRLGLSLAGLGLILVLGLGFGLRERLAERFGTLGHLTSTLSASMRMDTWNDCLPAFRDYAWLGAGGNAFRMVFPQYRSATTRQSFGNAENEYLQIPVELGLMGSLLGLAIAVCILHRWLRNRAQLPLCLHAAVLGAVVTCLVHACFDFATRVPLYALTLACLLGLTQFTPSTASPRLRARQLARPGPVLTFIILGVIALQVRDVHRLDSPDYLAKAGRDDLIQAVTWAPTSPWAWYNLGRVAMQKNNSDIRQVAEKLIATAIVYDPNNYILWRELAPLRLTLGDRDGAAAAYTELKRLRPWAGNAELDAELLTQP